ncbi:MAG: alanine--glyoxylate aminotransferase family protein [Phycisphaerales bacterium]|nr:alanine--glyoxylate aminotransferase family protein [Phycisphaerales bacterium]
MPTELLPHAIPAHRPLWFRLGDLVFKVATEASELQQVHELNYLTFVREIGQHEDLGRPTLVDKFHERNLYLIATRAGSVVAMLAVHDRPPFSVATRLEDPAWIERNCPRPVEVRLLAVRPTERQSVVLPGLLWLLYRHAGTAGYSHMLASGVRQQLGMYRKLGFEAIGVERPSGHAYFTPLVMPVESLPEPMLRMAARLERRAACVPTSASPLPSNPDPPPTQPEHIVSLLPGPPEFSRDVVLAFAERPTSHREPECVTRFERCRRVLGEMAGNVDAAILVGSGTLANECVAATLASMRRPGLVLVNGEFGARLAEQARRWGLEFERLEWNWGRPWDLPRIDAALKSLGTGSWIWGVHGETSTGVLNPIEVLVELARARGLRVCLDCVSTLGSVPLNLDGVFLASSTSGKCLGSFAGLAVLLGNARHVRDAVTENVPLALDARAAFDSRGPRFTVPSSLIGALDAAISRFDTPTKRAREYARIHRLGAAVRAGLRRMHAEPVAPDAYASPSVTTFEPPIGCSPERLSLACRAFGFEINVRSPYLPARGWAQIATMGNVHEGDIERLFTALAGRHNHDS